MQLKERIKHSLFLKIILIFLAAHLIIASVGFAVHKYFSSMPHHFRMDKNMTQYSSYLIKEMGFPPDTLLAKQLADSLYIGIKFSSPHLSWSSETKDFDFNADLLQWHNIPGNKQFSIAYIPDALLVRDTTPQGVYILLFKSRVWENGSDIQWRILGMVLFMMFILLILYFIIRRLLQPIEQLDEATRQLSAGNLDYKLVSTRKDELGDLVQSFNFMTARIKEMLKARDQLLLDASHELRSPLTRIKVALEFVEDSSAKRNINDDINDMETMIAELLEKERLDSPYGGLYKTTVNLNELLHKICHAYTNRKPGLTLNMPDTPLLLQADGERLRMALDNLVQNGLKYSAPDSPAVQVTVTASGNEVHIAVRDYGRGIPQNEIAYIFEPFYRVDKSRSKHSGGYGLGMSLVKKIIEMHGGRIEIDSTPGEGTTVRIVLTRKEDVNN